MERIPRVQLSMGTALRRINKFNPQEAEELEPLNCTWTCFWLLQEAAVLYLFPASFSTMGAGEDNRRLDLTRVAFFKSVGKRARKIEHRR